MKIIEFIIIAPLNPTPIGKNYIIPLADTIDCIQYSVRENQSTEFCVQHYNK